MCVVFACVVALYFAISYCVFLFFKQKAAYDVRISDWSSDVCSSDLLCRTLARAGLGHPELALLHGKFDVPHIAIMRFQDSENLSEFGIGLEIGRASCRERVCQYV